MARRAARATPIAPVVWRDGVHLTGTPIWCDARRRQDICFVSSVERVLRAGHGQLIATPLTLALLDSGNDGHLGVPLRQRFTLGTVRLELIPSGRGLGAAALFADIAGRTVLYANTVRTVAGGAGDPAEVRACDALVVGAPFGEEHHVFPPLARVMDETIAWANTQLAAGRRPVLFVDSVLDGLEVAKTLHDRGVAVSGHRAIREAATRGGLRPIAMVGKELRAVIWLDTDHAGLAKAVKGSASTASGSKAGATKVGAATASATHASAAHASAANASAANASAANASAANASAANASAANARAANASATIVGSMSFATALVSGRAIESAAGYDAAFAWATAADRAQLLGWIEAANARAVFVTGPCADAIAAAVGPHARVIGPPQQMALFAR